MRLQLLEEPHDAQIARPALIVLLCARPVALSVTSTTRRRTRISDCHTFSSRCRHPQHCKFFLSRCLLSPVHLVLRARRSVLGQARRSQRYKEDWDFELDFQLSAAPAFTYRLSLLTLNSPPTASRLPLDFPSSALHRLSKFGVHRNPQLTSLPPCTPPFFPPFVPSRVSQHICCDM